MGIILLFSLWVEAALFALVFWRLTKSQPSFIKLAAHWATWAGLACAFLAQLAYLWQIIRAKEVPAFELFFFSTWELGVYPLGVALVLSFLPRAWTWAHISAQILTSFALFNIVLCFLHLFSSEWLYAYFHITVRH